jgi:hypothetical protein
VGLGENVDEVKALDIGQALVILEAMAENTEDSKFFMPRHSFVGNVIAAFCRRGSVSNTAVIKINNAIRAELGVYAAFVNVQLVRCIRFFFILSQIVIFKCINEESNKTNILSFFKGMFFRFLLF